MKKICFLFTISMLSFLLHLNAQNRLEVDGDAYVNGNFGVGLTVPLARLHVEGPIAELLRLSGTSPFISFYTDAGATYGTFLQHFSDEEFYVANRLGGLRFWTANNLAMRIDEDGQVGIGTASPLNLLHIAGDASADIRLEASGAKYLRFYEGSIEKSIFGHNGTDIIIRNYETGGDVRIGANGSTDMIIETGGNVGIGTDSPEAKFHLFNGDGASQAPPSSLVDMYLEDDANCYIEFNGVVSGITFNDDNTSIRAGYLFSNSSDQLWLRTGSSTRMYVEENGLVGINDASPSAMLHIKQQGGDEEGLAIENDGDEDVWSWEVGANDLFLYFNDNIVGQWDDATGNYMANSDQRLKKNITSLENGYLEKLMLLSPKKYYFNHDQEMEKMAFGYLAQDVLKIFPDVVRETDNEDGYLGLDYQKVGVIAVKAIQELNKKVEELEAELASKNKQLESMEALEARMAKIEALLEE